MAQRETDRTRAAEWVGTGAGMLGAGVAGNALLDERLRRRGSAQLGLSAYRSVRRKPGGLSWKTHGPHLAGRAVTRGVQLAAVPVLATGVYGLATGRRTEKLRPGRDVVTPTLRSTVLADNLAKALTAREQRAVNAHKKTGQGLALVSGSLGVAALALRSPQGAKALSRRGVKAPALTRLAGREAAATRASDTLGVGAIGAGSVGSFNYARQQQLERRQYAVRKGLRLPDGRLVRMRSKLVRGGLGDAHHIQARIARQKVGQMDVAPQPHRGRTLVSKPGEVEWVAVNPDMRRKGIATAMWRHAERTGMRPLHSDNTSDEGAAWARAVGGGKVVRKGFLREHRDRISPDAERGYRTLRSQRNDATVSAAGSAALAGLSGTVLHSEWKNLSKPALALTAAGGVAAGYGAVRSGVTAARRQRRMDSIEAKGRARAKLGLYAPGRGRTPVDSTSAQARRYPS